MSWWTNVRDKYVKFATVGMYDPADSRHNEADARYAMNEQMKAYRDQTQLTRAETDRKRNEEVSEKRRIEEKQIRSLRRNYRTSGILGGSAEPVQGDMNQKLGG